MGGGSIVTATLFSSPTYSNRRLEPAPGRFPRYSLSFRNSTRDAMYAATFMRINFLKLHPIPDFFFPSNKVNKRIDFSVCTTYNLE